MLPELGAAEASTQSSVGDSIAAVSAKTKAAHRLGTIEVTTIGFRCMNLAGIYKPATDVDETVTPNPAPVAEPDASNTTAADDFDSTV